MKENVENSEMSSESLRKKNFMLIKENSSLKKRMRWERSFWIAVIIVLVILLLRTCNELKLSEKDNQNKKAQIDYLSNRVLNLLNNKAVLVVKDTMVNKKSGKYAMAILVNMNDKRPANLFLEDKRILVPYKVEVPVSAPVDSSAIIMLEDCAKANEGLAALLIETNNLLEDSIVACMDKQYRDDSAVIMMQRKIQLRSFLLNPPPSINYSNVYIEYLPNPYRQKTKNAFWTMLGSATASVLFYAHSEQLGNPIFIDGADNSKAQRKSDGILGLRILSGASAAFTLFEASRTIHFWNMESKFIVDPTTLKFVLYLDK